MQKIVHRLYHRTKNVYKLTIITIVYIILIYHTCSKLFYVHSIDMQQEYADFVVTIVGSFVNSHTFQLEPYFIKKYCLY